MRTRRPSPAVSRRDADRRRLGRAATIERLEERHALAAADLLPTLDEVRAEAYQIVEAPLLAFDNRQIAARSDVNVGSEVTLYPFIPRWNFDYDVSVWASRRSGMDPVIAVYDTESGERLGFHDDVSTDDSSSQLTLPLLAGHRYTLAVTSYDTGVTGGYEIVLQAAIEDDGRENDDQPRGGVATDIVDLAASTFTGTMADAHDYFRIRLTGPARTGASISLDFDAELGDLDLRLLDRSGRQITASEGTTDRETLLLGGLPAGVYYVDVHGYSGAYNPSYTLTSNVRVGDTRAVITADRFEANNTRAKATKLGSIVATSEATGLTLTRRDVDFYEFSLVTPGTATSDVMVSFEHALGDIDIQVLDSAGRLVDSSNGTDNSERVSLADLPAGNYFLRVFGYRGAANPSYSIRFNHGTVLDTPESLPYLGGGVTPPPPPPPPPATNAWTIAVYMTSTDLADFAFDDINEMEAAVARFAPGASITVFWDQWQGKSFVTGGGSQAAWGTAGRAVITPDTNMSSIATTFEIVGERNTGDPAVLRDFLSWTMQVKPATRYGVLMWDHGGGLTGVNFDDESGYDSITVKELARGIADAGMSPSVLMYDACLMGNVENFYELRNVAPVQVASEEVIFGPGFDYRTAFSTLNTSPANVTPEALAQGVVTSFTTQYGTDGASTIAAVKSSGMNAVAAAMKTFADAAEGFTATQVTRLRGLVGRVTRFEYPQYVDLGQIMQRVAATSTFSSATRTAATAVTTAVQSAVFARMADERQTSGMSVYLPTSTSQEMPEIGQYAEWNAATGWSRIVNRVLGRGANARGGDGFGSFWEYAERRR
jgi:hypothetical protein